jgi:hypothetical protein
MQHTGSPNPWLWRSKICATTSINQLSQIQMITFEKIGVYLHHFIVNNGSTVTIFCSTNLQLWVLFLLFHTYPNDPSPKNASPWQSVPSIFVAMRPQDETSPLILWQNVTKIGRRLYYPFPFSKLWYHFCDKTSQKPVMLNLLGLRWFPHRPIFQHVLKICRKFSPTIYVTDDIFVKQNIADTTADYAKFVDFTRILNQNPYFHLDKEL